MKIKKILIPFLIAVVITAFCASGILFSINARINDDLYQKTGVANPDIAVIGIDSDSIDAFGPFPWDRKIFAELINLLNKDRENAPAVIGIDVLFTGKSDEISDKMLVEAVRNSQNVVISGTANYTTRFVEFEGGGADLDNSFIEKFDVAFPELVEVSKIGHVNSGVDDDGILRYAKGDLTLPSGEVVLSLNEKLYQEYCLYKNIPAGDKPPVNSYGNWYLPYTAKTDGYYDNYSVSKILSGEIPADIFAGKIVLIGAYTVGLQDHYITPIDRTEFMYGVEHHANAVQAHIEQNYKKVMPFWLNIVIVFSVTLLLLIVLRGKKILFSSIVSVAGIVMWIIFAIIMYNFGLIFDAGYLIFSLGIAYIISIAENYITVAMEKSKVTSTFKRYVAPEIVTEILREGTDSLGLGGKQTDIAVMFADVRKFTPMSEKFPAEIVVEILNRLLNVTANNVMKHKGTLDKFIGDSTMAFWGAPFPQEDYVFNAVMAAADIIKELKIVCAEIEKEYDHTVAIGIGIHCGTSVVGNIGYPDRMDFTAIGDTVNTAARLESNAPANTLYVSEEVVNRLKGRVEFVKIAEELKLKGKEGTFPVFTLADKYL